MFRFGVSGTRNGTQTEYKSEHESEYWGMWGENLGHMGHLANMGRNTKRNTGGTKMHAVPVPGEKVFRFGVAPA